MTPCTIVIAAGGTGGHFFPAEALAAVLRARGHRIVLMTDARSGGLVSPAFEGCERFVLAGAGIAGRGAAKAAQAAREERAGGMRLVRSSASTCVSFSSDTKVSAHAWAVWMVTWKKFWWAASSVVVFVPPVAFFFSFSGFSAEHWSYVVEHEALAE